MKKIIFFISLIILFFYCPANATYKSHLAEIGASFGRAVTDTLYVSPNGSGVNGYTWDTAYTTIQSAMDAASTDSGDCTLIYISPISTHYNIDTTGDPTWTGNYILKGSHRTWLKIKNDHAGATSIMKFTGKVSLIDLNFNLGTGSNNGVIFTFGAWRVSHCQFVGESLTGAATALHFDGATILKHGILRNCHFNGNAAYMTGILLDKNARSHFEHVYLHDCLVGIQIVDAISDANSFKELDIDCSGIGFDIDAGNGQHFINCSFHDNTTDIDDEVEDHSFEHITGEFAMTIYPDNFTGVQLDASNDANEWGADVEIRSAAEATIPFRVIGYSVSDLSVSQKYKIRFSADSGATYFDEICIEATKLLGSGAPSGTEFIFNKGTQIVASTKAESGGEDTLTVCIKIQEI